MATIKFVQPQDKDFAAVVDQVERGLMSREMYDRLPEGERSSRTCVVHQGSPDEPQLLEIKMAPDTGVQPHAHEADEIVVVLDGHIRFGNQVCGAGASVFIPRETLYSFTAGPEGARFLNFRPTGEYGYIPKEELLTRRTPKPV